MILDAVASIQGLATDDVPPTSHPFPITNVFRADVERQCLTPERALAGAPAVESSWCRGYSETSTDLSAHPSVRDPRLERRARGLPLISENAAP